jgi:hypothetical protein
VLFAFLLVVPALFGVTAGLVTVGLAGISFVVTWFGLPLVRKARLNSARPASQPGRPTVRSRS